MPITTLPAAPSRAEPSTFSAKGDALLGALDLFVTEANALETNVNAKEVNTNADAIATAADVVLTHADVVLTNADVVSCAASLASAIAAPGTYATSVTGLTIGIASKTLTVETGKEFHVGMSVKIAYTTTPTNWMHGDITAYNSGTGSLTVNVTTINGSGTQSEWTVTLSAPVVSPFRWSVITSNPNPAVTNNGYICDTSGAAFSVTLPAAPAVGDIISFTDGASTFDTENLTIGRNSLKIMGLDEDMTVLTKNAAFSLVYESAAKGWRIA